MTIQYDDSLCLYATQDDVIPFATLCLNYWPYKTGEKLRNYFAHLHICSKTEKYVDTLQIYCLARVIHQPNSNPTYLLCLVDAKALSLAEQLKNAGNLFFIKSNIFEFEENHKYYREIPPDAARNESDDLCTEKNLAAFMTRTIFEMNEGRRPSPEEEKAFSISPNGIRTWLGPIYPNIPASRTFKPNDSERTEIADFISLARILEQTDEKCLARMVKYRYPNLSKTEVYDFVHPNNDATDKQKDSQGTRWGITEEKRRKNKEPRS